MEEASRHPTPKLASGRGLPAAETLERIQAFRPRMKRAMHFRIRTPRIEFNYLEARAAIDCADEEWAPKTINPTTISAIRSQPFRIALGIFICSSFRKPVVKSRSE